MRLWIVDVEMSGDLGCCTNGMDVLCMGEGHEFGEHKCGMLLTVYVPPQNSWRSPNPSVAVFVDGASKKVVKVKS